MDKKLALKNVIVSLLITTSMFLLDALSYYILSKVDFLAFFGRLNLDIIALPIGFLLITVHAAWNYLVALLSLFLYSLFPGFAPLKNLFDMHAFIFILNFFAIYFFIIFTSKPKHKQIKK